MKRVFDFLCHNRTHRAGLLSVLSIAILGLLGKVVADRLLSPAAGTLILMVFLKLSGLFGLLYALAFLCQCLRIEGRSIKFVQPKGGEWFR